MTTGTSLRQGKSILKVLRNVIFSIIILCCVSGCNVDVYQGLSEKEANVMLAILLKNGLEVEKVSQGKNGFTIQVEETQLVQALDILNTNSLPREKYQNLGTVFMGDSMIASPTEESARMAYAIAQELSDTISRIDGVITARVHIVLGKKNQTNDVVTQPSASILVRHTFDSPVTTFTPQLRSMAEKAVPDLKEDAISITLMPVREAVSTPSTPAPGVFTMFFQNMGQSILMVILLSLTSLGAFVYLVRLVLQYTKDKKNKADMRTDA